MRRHDSGRMIQARRGSFVNGSPAPGPNMPCCTTSGHSASGTDGRTQPQHALDIGRACRPGSTVVNWSVFVSVALRPVSRLMRMVHQPAGRHRIGCETSTAWMRPGGTISVTVVKRPNVIRTPSGVGAIEYRSERTIERTQYAPTPMMAGTKPNSSHVTPCDDPTTTPIVARTRKTVVG